uniref:E3 ubiquitin-protein ligase BRE1A n=1 Tax=Mycena chlorophos TaxID=658473 RepID=A0ABQ0L5K8_MYCCL|nr:E3 ubiquitin-protein ligase BRE1A [Mycena chlorophos]
MPKEPSTSSAERRSRVRMQHLPAQNAGAVEVNTSPPRSSPRQMVSLLPAPFGRWQTVLREMPEGTRIRFRRPAFGTLHPGWRRWIGKGIPKEEMLKPGPFPRYVANPRKPEDECQICGGMKNHPVKCACGHSFCYLCIYASLQLCWECPTCKTTIRRAPEQDGDLEDRLIAGYPAIGSDFSRPTYRFDTLMFPTC